MGHCRSSRQLLVLVLTLAAALASAPFLLAQPTGPGVVEGRVVDAASGEPLPGAKVIVTGLAAEASTDRDGRFRLAAVPAGPHSVVITYLGRKDEIVETTVTAQETAIVQPEVETVRRLAPAEMDARLAWQRGMLIFNGETLEVVLAEIDRYTNTEFLLADDSLRTVRIGGYFRAGDIDGLLIALRENFNIDWRRDEKNRVILSAATPRG